MSSIFEKRNVETFFLVDYCEKMSLGTYWKEIHIQSRKTISDIFFVAKATRKSSIGQLAKKKNYWNPGNFFY